MVKLSILLKNILEVHQGNVLGSLFFLIMIYDLAFIIDLMCKLIADTTLGDVDRDLNTQINRFIERFSLNGVKFNKLDINWSKAYFCLRLIKESNYQMK
jgi:hypothetical protein